MLLFQLFNALLYSTRSDSLFISIQHTARESNMTLWSGSCFLLRASLFPLTKITVFVDCIVIKSSNSRKSKNIFQNLVFLQNKHTFNMSNNSKMLKKSLLIKLISYKLTCKLFYVCQTYKNFPPLQLFDINVSRH